MDRSLFRAINRLADHTHWAHGIATAYAKYGIVLFALLLVVAYLDARRYDNRRALTTTIWAAAAALVALGVAQLIGGAVDRARPYKAMTDIHVLIDKTTDFSFPSDHATAAGAVATGLLLANKRWGIIAGVAALLMAFTRVYVGAHYPSDVLAGLALGAIIAIIGVLALVPLLTGLVEHLSHTPVRPLITHARSSPRHPPTRSS